MAIKIQGVSVLRDEIESDTFDTSTDNLQNIRDELVVVDTEVGDIQTDTTAMIASLVTIDDEIAAIQTDTTAMIASLVTIDNEIADIQTDTTAMIASLVTIDNEIGAIQTDTTTIISDIGDVDTQLDSMSGATFNAGTDSLEAIRDAINSITGSEAYKMVDVTSAANAGYVTLGTVTTGACTIQSVVIHADAAAPTQVDLTSCAITGGDGDANDPVIFLDIKDAKKANVDSKYEQVAWTGEVYLPVGAKISMNLIGTGATAVDMTVAIRFMATTLVNPGTLG